MDIRHLHRDVIGFLRLLRRHRPHRADHGTRKGADLLSLNIGLKHGDIPLHLNVANRNARRHQRFLERERAADQKPHIALFPVRRDIGELFGHDTVLIDPVARHIAADISALAHRVGLGTSFNHFQHRAGKRILLGVALKIGRILSGQNDQVRLGIAPAHPGGRKINLPLPNQLPNLRGFPVDIRGDVKSHRFAPFLNQRALPVSVTFRHLPASQPRFRCVASAASYARTAVTPISTFAFFGSAATWKAARAGYGAAKNSA